MLGIGITTYNRRDRLAQCLDGVRRHTTGLYVTLVADDGSTDRTLDLLNAERIPHITGRNMGIAWNKNRAIFSLINEFRCSQIVLLEDDTIPQRTGWDTIWRQAAEKWGHANYSGPWFKDKMMSGAGTLENPHLSTRFSGQVTCFSAEAIGAVGYFDTRFSRYGYEHIDHTWRMVRGGFGGLPGNPPICYLIESDVLVFGDVSSRDDNALRSNRRVLDKSSAEFFPRFPYRDDAEYSQFMGEIAAVRFAERVQSGSH